MRQPFFKNKLHRAGCINTELINTVSTSDQTIATQTFKRSYWTTIAVATV